MTSRAISVDKKQRGFTLTEVLIILAIIIVLSVVAIPLSNSIQVGAQLNDSTSGIIQTVRTAQNQARAGLNNSNHGVYFDISPTGADSYILYQGNSYSVRDSAFDRVYTINKSIELSTSLSGDEINFSKTTADSDSSGSITLTHQNGDSRSMTINNFGVIDEN